MVAAAERGHGVGGGAARSGRAISVRVDVFMSCISSLIARKSFSVVARTIEQGGGMNECDVNTSSCARLQLIFTRVVRA